MSKKGFESDDYKPVQSVLQNVAEHDNRKNALFVTFSVHLIEVVKKVTNMRSGSTSET